MMVRGSGCPTESGHLGSEELDSEIATEDNLEYIACRIFFSTILALASNSGRLGAKPVSRIQHLRATEGLDQTMRNQGKVRLFRVL